MTDQIDYIPRRLSWKDRDKQSRELKHEVQEDLLLQQFDESLIILNGGSL